MKELKVKNNETGLSVYINGIPNLKLIPKKDEEILISSLEVKMTEYFKNRTHNKKFWHKVLTTFLDTFRHERTILDHRYGAF